MPTLLLTGAILVLCSSCAFVFPQGPAKPPTDDAVLNLYRNDSLRPLLIEYYTRLTDNRTVALAILDVCDELNIPPSLGFALAWNESKFNPLAVNVNMTSVDRGLFQLNSRTFTRLNRAAVFDPRKNAFHGLAYFKKACSVLGSIEKGLGYYNSGIGMLTDRPLPRSTLSYVKRILNDRKTMDRDAIAWIYFSHDAQLVLR